MKKKISEKRQDGLVTTGYLDKKFEDFAIMVQHGFTSIEDRLGTRVDGLVTKDEFNGFKHDTEMSFYGLDRKVGVIDERLGRVEGRLEKVESKLDAVVIELRGHDKRIGALELAAR
jgi:hypothetical protein